MTCRLALRSAAGVCGLSRMTPLCGNSHRAGLAGRPGAWGGVDLRRSRRGFGNRDVGSVVLACRASAACARKVPAQLAR
jgi:hypothetical protein